MTFEDFSAYRILVVGSGSAAKRHLIYSKKYFHSAQIAWLGSERIAHEVSPEILRFSDYDRGLEFNPDLVVIASPASRHYTDLKYFIDTKAKFVIEKPISMNLREAELMIELFRDRDIEYLIAYQLEFSQSLDWLIDFLKKEKLQISFVQAEVGQWLPDWRPDRDYKSTVTANKSLGGGVLRELSHEIHYLLRIFGFPESLTGLVVKLSNLEMDCEDYCKITYFTTGANSNRILVDVTLDCIRIKRSRTLQIFYEGGQIVWDGLEDKITSVSQAGDVNILFEGNPEVTVIDELWSAIALFSKDELKAHNLNTRALAVMAIIESVETSSHSGESVKVNYPSIVSGTYK